MDRQRLRKEALEVLLQGGSYREARETEAAMKALLDAPDIPMLVPIRFRKRYEDMKKETDLETNPDSR